MTIVRNRLDMNIGERQRVFEGHSELEALNRIKDNLQAIAKMKLPKVTGVGVLKLPCLVHHTVSVADL